eukprot:1195508-Prorocentrum_minimum.AAC.1
MLRTVRGTRMCAQSRAGAERGHTVSARRGSRTVADALGGSWAYCSTNQPTRGFVDQVVDLPHVGNSTLLITEGLT